MEVMVRVEGSDPPVYLIGRDTGTHNVIVEHEARIDVYVPVGSEDGETVYRHVGSERK